MSTATRILTIIRPHSALVVGAVVCVLATSATTVAYAWLAGPILATVHRPDQTFRFGPLEASDAAGTVVLLAATVVAITVARAVATYGRRMLSVHVGQRVVRRLRQRMYDHLLDAAPEVLVSQRAGELASRLCTDATQVETLVSNNLAAAFADVVTLIALSFLAVSLDPTLAVIALAAVPPVVLAVVFIARRVRTANRDVFEELAELSSRAADLADSIPVLRSYGAQPHARESFSAHVARLQEVVTRSQRWLALATPTTLILGALAVATSLLAAAPRLVDGSLAPETFVSFFAAVALLYRPVAGLGATVQRVASGLAALDRVDEVVGLPTEPPDAEGAIDIEPMRERLTMRGIGFAYAPDAAVLEAVDLELRAGESIAIVGASGEGKTTLLRILLGLLAADEGTLAIDGHARAGVRAASWRRQFAWVTQEPLVFADTILANVALAEPHPPDVERARRCLEMAGAGPLLASLDHGMDTVLSEGGRELSGGQRQRLCIARALYRDAPVLVFDEATSSLDGPSERAIAATIEELMSERTVVLVSHRLGTVARADRALVLSGGRVIERGSPGSLWETGGRFHELFSDATIQ